MKTTTETTKYFEFLPEEKELINDILVKHYGDRTIGSIVEAWFCPHFFFPLLSAYGKLMGITGRSDRVRFTYDEKKTLCDMLRNEFQKTNEKESKDKIKELLEEIFNQD